MGWLLGRLFTVAVLLVAAAGLWHILDGFKYRLMFTSLPILFAAQVTASDILEDILTSNIGWRTRWFTLIIAPGTILHEICHLTAALATGCNITRAALFKPNPRTGVLGFVGYTQPADRWVVFREFLVGFAPFFGCGIIMLALSIPLGGGLISLIDQRPLTSYQDYVDLTGRLIKSFTRHLGYVDYSKPLVWVIVYLQLCFTVGAAPSTADFHGAFSSIYRHIFSAVFFILLAAFIILASQEDVVIGDFRLILSPAIGLALKFVTVTMLLSITLTSALIPVAYFGVKTLEVEGLGKTIPLTSGFLTYYTLAKTMDPAKAALWAAATATGSLAVLMLLGNKKGGGKTK